jgi:DNA polymerase-3 subunit gamma/tau
LRGASAARAAFAEARSASARRATNGADDEPAPAPLTDDSAVSDDDEDIVVSGDIGRSVIEKVLGGRVVQEIEE